MNPKDKAKYFAYGLLSAENASHHEILNVLNWYPENGVQSEFIYKHRLTDFAPEDSILCKVIKGLPTLKRNGILGLFLNQPYGVQTDSIAQAIAGTMIRNNKPTRVMQLTEALQKLKDPGLYASPVYVLTYPTRYNGNERDFKQESLFNLFLWAQKKGVFLILINDSTITDVLNLSFEEQNYIDSRFKTLEG